jgi:hypothetical protein
VADRGDGSPAVTEQDLGVPKLRILCVSKLLFRNEARVPGVAAQTVLKGGIAVPCTTQG